MTYAEVINKSSIAKHIPLRVEGRGLPKGMNSSVILVRVQYEKYIEEFNGIMDKVLKQLKKEGYDERISEYQAMQEIYARKKKIEDGVEEEGLVEPSEEELKKADNTKAKEDEIKAEIKELDEEYSKAYNEKLREEVKINERKFSKEELDELIEMIGLDGTIKINDKEVNKEELIYLIGVLFA